MKAHLAAWAVAIALVATGFTVAGCDPNEQKPPTTEQICIRGGEAVECK